MERNIRKLTVRRCFSFLLFLFTLMGILPSISLALDCNSPPRGFGGSWARAYKNWCESCGGTYSSGPRCTPGRNWGGGQQGSTPSYDNEAERQRQEAERLYREEQERLRQKEMEEQRRRDEEEARKLREEFEKNKQDALKSIKGININEPGLKGLDTGGDPGLKGIGHTGAGGHDLKEIETSAPLFSDDSAKKPADTVKSRSKEPAAEEIQKSIDAARKRIPQLEGNIKGLQTLLAQFGASQRSNVSELEKWQATFHEAAENSRKNAVDYGLSMLLQYNLMGSLERSVKKDVYDRLDALINTSDHKMRRWLGEQLKERNIELSRVQKIVTAGSLGGDLAVLLSGDLRDSGKTLDALLFVNDLLETTKVVSWAGSQYFQQAKMIGETYSDLAAFGYSAVNIRKAQKATDAYNREIQHLSAKLRDSTREMNCLKGCLDNYKERCLDKCTGKTRFGTPPPTPR
jgi:hypothetical protein